MQYSYRISRLSVGSRPGSAHVHFNTHIDNMQMRFSGKPAAAIWGPGTSVSIVRLIAEAFP